MSLSTDAGTAVRPADREPPRAPAGEHARSRRRDRQRRLARPRARQTRSARSLVRRGVHLAADSQGIHRAIRGLPAVLLLDREAVDGPRGNLGMGVAVPVRRRGDARFGPSRRARSQALRPADRPGERSPSCDEPVRRQVVAAGAGLPAPARREPRSRRCSCFARSTGAHAPPGRCTGSRTRCCSSRTPSWVSCSCLLMQCWCSSGATESFRTACSLQ